ncbi:hypothetical protein AB0J20_11910 [Micromonospora costi]|uniref:hypothetical protein n=1 Tax=Micromonospora costi TaxID=1530042 RepID=UPI0033FCBECA
MSDQPPPAAPPPGQPDPSGPHPGWSSPSGPPYGAGPPASGAAGPPYDAATPPSWDPAAPPAWSPAAPPPWDPSGAPTPQGWGYPATGHPGGYPPAAGPYGGPPWYPGPPAGWYPPGIDPADPLVTPPGARLNGWYERLVGGIQRGWRVLFPVLLLTQALPAAVLSVVSLGVDPTARWEASTVQDPAALPDTFFQDLATVLLVSVGGGLLIGFVQGIGWAAGTWTLARQAAGQPVDVGAALRYGLRRALGLWGWTLLCGLIIGVGVCFCVIPGIYLAFALSMVGPIYLFERQNPIGRSFRMFHQRLGLLLGRVALVAVVVIVGSVVVGLLQGAATAPFGLDPLAAPGTAIGVVVVLALTAVVTLPVQLVQLVGFVVTYAEQRAHEGPVNSAGLVAELG